MIGVEKLVEIRYLQRQGLNVSQIARRLGLDRKTVRKYLLQLQKGLDPVLPPEKNKRISVLDPFKPYLQYRLQGWPELTATRLHREISTLAYPEGDAAPALPGEPYSGSERTVRRYLAQTRPRSQRIYRPVETLPGEQAQADWGYFGYLATEGGRRRLYGFSFVLSYSRVRYVEFTTSQDLVTFLGCLQRALQYVGGVVECILFDNAKTVVTERVGSVIQFNRDLLRLAAQYGFRPEACWMNDPETKGKVENSIQYARRDCFYGRQWTELEELNREALAWCDQVANEKLHQNTREIPLDRLAEERQALAPLPRQQVPIFMELKRYVRKDRTFTSKPTNTWLHPAALATR